MRRAYRGRDAARSLAHVKAVVSWQWSVMKEHSERICILCWTRARRRTPAFRQIDGDDLCRAHIITEGHELTDGEAIGKPLPAPASVIFTPDYVARTASRSRCPAPLAVEEESETAMKSSSERLPCIYPGCKGTHKATSKHPYCSDCTIHNRHKLKAEVARRAALEGTSLPAPDGRKRKHPPREYIRKGKSTNGANGHGLAGGGELWHHPLAKRGSPEQFDLAPTARGACADAA